MYALDIIFFYPIILELMYEKIYNDIFACGDDTPIRAG